MATVITAAFVVIYWLCLWRNSVNWTTARTAKTALSGVGCAIAGMICAYIASEAARIHDTTFILVFSGVVAVISWLPITILIWKETALERIERLRLAASDVLFCPRCGYNMTGLREARCPECGAQYTINQLIATQQRPEIADAAASQEERAGTSGCL